MGTFYGCPLCSKHCRSERALEQHTLDKDGGRNDRRSSRRQRSHEHLAPHEEIEGYWVRAQTFKAGKSFGRYQCPNCKKQWGSAHAFREFKQGCKRCEMKSFPCCLWVNTDENHHDTGSDDEKGPHDSARCEACRKGKCRF